MMLYQLSYLHLLSRAFSVVPRAFGLRHATRDVLFASRATRSTFAIRVIRVAPDTASHSIYALP